MIIDEPIKRLVLDQSGNPDWPLPDLALYPPESWILLSDDQCRLNPGLPQILSRSAAERPDISLFFGDEVIAGDLRKQTKTFIYKSDIDQTQLIANDYIGWPLLIKANVLDEVGRRCRPRSGAFTYDLILHLLSSGHAIGRITEVLGARNEPLLRASHANRKKVLQNWLEETDPDYEIKNGRIAGTLRLSRRFDIFPDVTLIVPTRQVPCPIGSAPMLNSPHLLNLLDSFSRSSWPADRLTVLIGDDGEDDAAFDSLAHPFKLKRVAVTGSAAPSYARKMNDLWQSADTEHVIFMNDDLVALDPDWIAALLTFSMQEDVGGAAARILDADGRIKHAGIAGGSMGVCIPMFSGMSADLPTYSNWADIHREWSMVLGSAFATRRSVLAKIGGFDERFSAAFGDVDMCMRMRMLGFRIIYTPHAELIHVESASQDTADRAGSEVALFLQRWRDLLADDPAYHPGLSRTWSISDALASDPPLWVR